MPSVAVAKTKDQLESNLPPHLRTSYLLDAHRLGLHELGTVESESCPFCKEKKAAMEARQAREASNSQLSPEIKAALALLGNPPFNLTDINKAYHK